MSFKKIKTILTMREKEGEKISAKKEIKKS